MQELPSINLQGKKIAIVHDWLVAYAGADRVIDQLHTLFPDAPIYTLVFNAKAFPERFQHYDIRTTWFQKIPFATKLYKNMFTLMPSAFEQLDLTEYDIVISSCTSCSKGVITRPDAVHICYCNTPTRYIWNFYHEYLRNSGWLKRKIMPGMIRKMRLWDYVAAQRVDWFIGNSTAVAQRIKKYYRRDAEIIYPGVRMNTLPLSYPEDYYLMVGRFTHYKRFDIGIEACTRLRKKLVVVGTGEEEKKLRAIAGPNVIFKGYLQDNEIRELYTKAKAFLFPGEEDFGITPVEAQSGGCPVLAYRRGGVMDTIIDGQTGLFFDVQDADSLCDCIQRFETSGVSYSRAEISHHAESFSEGVFAQKIVDYITEKVSEEGNTL